VQHPVPEGRDLAGGEVARTRPNRTSGNPIHGVISRSWMAPMPVAMMLSSPEK
jgi:hypothetical protein